MRWSARVQIYSGTDPVPDGMDLVPDGTDLVPDGTTRYLMVRAWYGMVPDGTVPYHQYILELGPGVGKSVPPTVWWLSSARKAMPGLVLWLEGAYGCNLQLCPLKTKNT